MWFNKYIYSGDNRVGKMFPMMVDRGSQKPLNSTKEKLMGATGDVTSLYRRRSASPKMNIHQEPHFDHKSETARNVEEIAKNRCERRQKLAVEKSLREHLCWVNQHSPNYEFARMIKEARDNIQFQPLSNDDAIDENQITVCVRKRPLNKREIDKGHIDVVTVPAKGELIVHEPKTRFDMRKFLDNQVFRFDYVFDECCPNEVVYRFTAQPLVRTIFQGGRATCFAYGQTGAGKTHTMGGEFKGKHQNFNNGIYTLVARDVFDNLTLFIDCELEVYASFFEIYGKFAYDLLERRKRLRVMEDAQQLVQVVGLSEHRVNSVFDVMNLIRVGSLSRTHGQTSANSFSSRSHAVFQMVLRKEVDSSIYGKISLIDLAGNERGADTSKSSTKTRLEGAEINRSLLALKECIRALGKKGGHCPFRESILTQILRDSFIGENTRTCMIALISPNIGSIEHTLNTLRYADRVKEIGVAGSTPDESDDIYDTSNSESDIEIAPPPKVVDVLENMYSILHSSENFHKKTKKLYNVSKKSKHDKFELARSWRTLLRENIEEQRAAYLKLSELCDPFIK